MQYETREVASVDTDTQAMSSHILDMINLSGKVSEPGPGVYRCGEGENPDSLFRIRHTWNISGPPGKELKNSLERLRDKLPEEGWELVAYGPDSSLARTLTLIADQHKQQFGVKVELWDQREKDDVPALVVTVASDCYQVPPGQEVDRY
ncbi:hypothetical protein [Streptomyces sp. WMMC897]|uniref:hypothetical protein n=1 Tax=Streptomyces sp. WMMC897 TaxID=3014782 RepID=UPI0022B69524|nr:hypothetical protein [Streptomyces sp. WMMC897]MCZ7416342.1 hypothetical protein [Streptomyces sp. WMMC897]